MRHRCSSRRGRRPASPGREARCGGPVRSAREGARGGNRVQTATLSPLGVWRSLVARSVRVGEVPSSNLGTPIRAGEPMVPPPTPLLCRAPVARTWPPRRSGPPAATETAAANERTSNARETWDPVADDPLPSGTRAAATSTSPTRSPATGRSTSSSSRASSRTWRSPASTRATRVSRAGSSRSPGSSASTSAARASRTGTSGSRTSRRAWTTSAP